MATKIEERVKAAEERLKKLRAKNAREKARARTVQNRTARREETRRKVLVGAVVLARIEKGLLEESVLRGWMDGALERVEDRAMFGLPANLVSSSSDAANGGW
jgi:hypothetical protein